MKKIIPILFIAVVLGACSSKQDKKIDANSKKWRHYECAWFDFDYPAFMQVEETRNEISDTIPGLKEGGEVTVYGNYIPYWFKFVKSSMFEVFKTPEQWRDLSIEMKEYNKEGDEPVYLGIYETEDSLSFKGNPAASITYAVLERGDTLAMYQLVVLKESTKDLYYLNYNAPISKFDDYWNIADSVFNTIILK